MDKLVGEIEKMLSNLDIDFDFKVEHLMTGKELRSKLKKETCKNISQALASHINKDYIRKDRIEVDEEKVKKIIALFKKSTFCENGDFEWSDLKIDKEDNYIYVPQGSYLGETLITFGDNYENSGYDALLITELLKLAHAIAKAKIWKEQNG